MPDKKITPLPFLLIVGFSLIVMLAVVVAQYRSQNGISQLRNGNTQALVTFKVDNWLDEMVNETYVMEEEGKKFINLGTADHFNNLQQALLNLDKENTAIKKIALEQDSTANAVQALNLLVQKKSAPYRLLRMNASDSLKKNILASINDASAKQLTDSIYVTALQIQIALGKNLENTIVRNETLSERVLSFSWMMGVISIAAIAILASIIIRRLLQNFKLIRALDKAKTAAEKASEIKEQFLANMSHEIRTPINSVLGFTGLLEKTNLEEKQAQYVSYLKTSGQHLLSIINDILDLSKIESGRIQLTKSAFSLQQLCFDLEMMFYNGLTQKQLSFTCTIDKDVPELINGDKERLNQILMNLVSNAIKFTEHGEVTLKVSILKSWDKNLQLQFEVKDTGIGIKEDQLGRIFERFEQAEAGANRKYGGTGLGLSIVKSLVEIQGGIISAKSQYGHGAAFVFDLVFDMVDDDIIVDESQLTVKDKRFKNFTFCPGSRVLVAEDNIMNQRLLQYIFDTWDIRFDLAQNGKECIEKLKQQQYDILLMDIQMPEIDGYEATAIIRQQLKLTLPIIAMTANVLPGEMEKCIKIGMNDYLAKPISEDALYNVLTKNLPAIKQELKEKPALVNWTYLNHTFGGNKMFIQKMVDEFYIQLPKEVAALTSAANEKSITLVRTKSHHLKTTLSTVNNNSFLLAHLEQMEKIEDTPENWQQVHETLQLLTDLQNAAVTNSSIK